jgi:hypothetical protein
LIEIIINLLLIPTIGVFIDQIVIVTGAIVILVILFACLINRRGWTVVAGTMVVGVLELVFFSFVLNRPGGQLSSYALPFFDTLVFGVLFAALLLPEGAPFIVSLINSVFIVGAVLLLPRTDELNKILQVTPIADAAGRPILVQVISSIVCYVWARSSRGALERADRATTIAVLEHSLVQQGREVAHQKQQLELSLRQIVEAYTRAANGDLSARVPTPQDYSLWEMVGLLNNALARLQRLQRSETELQQIKRAVSYLSETMRQSGGKPIAWPETGTIFDAIAAQYNALAQATPRRTTGWQAQ